MTEPRFHTYHSREMKVEVDVCVLGDDDPYLHLEPYANVGVSEAGDYLVKWPDGHTSVVPPEIFVKAYSKATEHEFEEELKKIDLDPQ